MSPEPITWERYRSMFQYRAILHLDLFYYPSNGHLGYSRRALCATLGRETWSVSSRTSPPWWVYIYTPRYELLFKVLYQLHHSPSSTSQFAFHHKFTAPLPSIGWWGFYVSIHTFQRSMEGDCGAWNSRV